MQLGQQTITFASDEGATIGVSDDETVLNSSLVQDNGYTFRATYLNSPSVAAGTNVFKLSDTGGSFDLVDGGSTADFKAFRPYFTAPVPSGSRRVVKQISIGSDTQAEPFGIHETDPEEDLNGSLIISAKRHRIIVTSALRSPVSVNIVDLKGISVSTFTIEPGETIETRVPVGGVYVVRADGGRYQKKQVVR